MQVTQSKAPPAGAGLPILELWDIAANGSFVHSAGYTSALGAGRKHFANGFAGGVDNGSAERTFYILSSADSYVNGYPAADQMSGASQSITKLRTYAFCPAYGWTAGFVPSLDDAELLACTPNWTRITFEATIKKLAIGALDATCFGWQARGNSGMWNTLGGFRNAPGVTLFSPGGQGNWTQVMCRLDLSDGGAPFVAFNLTTPVNALVFHRLKTVVTLGPVFSVEFYIDDVLVKALSAADLAFVNLELANLDINSLYPCLNPSKDGGFFGAGSGMEGPYMSHLLVEVV